MSTVVTLCWSLARQLSPETGSTAGIKVQRLSLSLLRGERIQSQLELLVRQVQVRSRYVSQALWCSLGKSSYAEQGKRLCSIGDAAIHQLSERLNYSMLQQVRILPVKLPQAVCPQAVNQHLHISDKVPMPLLRCLRCDDVHSLYGETVPFCYSHIQSVMIYSCKCVQYRYLLVYFYTTWLI